MVQTKVAVGLAAVPKRWRRRLALKARDAGLRVRRANITRRALAEVVGTSPSR
jgi:hypothetical protein